MQFRSVPISEVMKNDKLSLSPKDYIKGENKMKQFMNWWGKFAFTEDEVRLENDTFYSDDNGYTPKNIEQINKLEIGEVWVCDDYGHSHIVCRVQDTIN